MQDILYGIPYKRLLVIRSAREQALIEEHKQELERQRKHNSDSIRKTILQA